MGRAFEQALSLRLERPRRVGARHSIDFPPGDTIGTFIRHENAERFVEEVRGDEPELAAKLGIEERELRRGGKN